MVEFPKSILTKWGHTLRFPIPDPSFEIICPTSKRIITKVFALIITHSNYNERHSTENDCHFLRWLRKFFGNSFALLTPEQKPLFGMRTIDFQWFCMENASKMAHFWCLIFFCSFAELEFQFNFSFISNFFFAFLLRSNLRMFRYILFPLAIKTARKSKEVAFVWWKHLSRWLRQPPTKIYTSMDCCWPKSTQKIAIELELFGSNHFLFSLLTSFWCSFDRVHQTPSHIHIWRWTFAFFFEN